MTPDPHSQAFFEAMYADSPDPWNFAGSAYEGMRYTQTVQALDGLHFRRAFEPGCSVGVLTERLADSCDHVEAMDISLRAVREAQARCSHLANVRIVQGALPADLPEGRFDLLVLSEIGYYFEVPALDEILAALIERVDRNGVVLAVHWLGVSRDHAIGGETVHERIERMPKLSKTLTFRYDNGPNERFRLDRWTRQ